MMGPSALPPHLRHELAQYIAATYDAAFNAVDSNTRREMATQDIARAIREVVSSTLASRLRAYNAAVWGQHCLPTELWHKVWDHLAFMDKLSVTAVCHVWRQMAFVCPALWTQVEIPWCTNDSCSDPENTGASYNVLNHVLSRSRLLPLALDIFASRGDDDADDGDRVLAHGALTKSLRPHAPRITAISIRTRGMCLQLNIPSQFDFTTLRELCLGRIEYVGSLALTPHMMPALERLDLSSTEDLVFKSGLVSFPSLRSLAVGFVHPDILERMLADAPQLSVFTMRCLSAIDFQLPTRRVSAALRARIARIPELHFSEVCQKTERWLARRLDHAANTRMSMTFQDRISLSVLRDITPTHIECSSHADRATILVRDSAHRARLVSMHASEFAVAFRDLWRQQLWLGLRGVTLTCDFTLFRQHPVALSALGVETLVLRVASWSDLEGLDHSDASNDDLAEALTRPRFPDLQHVVLKACGDWHGELDARVLWIILQRLRCDRVLQSVTLVGIELEEHGPDTLKSDTLTLNCVSQAQETDDLSEFLAAAARG